MGADCRSAGEGAQAGCVSFQRSRQRGAAIVLNVPGQALWHGVTKVEIEGFGTSWGR
jgi:hypothetical protein